MTIDLPYYAEWLEHHDKLGVERFYLFYADDVHAPLRDLLGYFPSDKISIARIPKAASEFDFTRFLPSSAPGEYTLHIDSDEMLILPQGEMIGAFIERTGSHDLYRFPWVMTPWTGVAKASLREQSASVPSYRVTQHKSMIRSELIAGCGDMHDFDFRAAPRSLFRNDAVYIQHFAARGLVDVYLRCRDQALRKNHPGDPGKLSRFLEPSLQEIRLGDIPKRLLATLGEIQCCNPRHVSFIPSNGASVTNHDLLAKLLSSGEMEVFTGRWNDLLKADLFAGFSIKDFPKLEIWNHLSGREDEAIKLSKS